MSNRKILDVLPSELQEQIISEVKQQMEAKKQTPAQIKKDIETWAASTKNSETKKQS